MTQKRTIFMSIAVYSIVLVIIGFGSDSLSITEKPIQISPIIETTSGQNTYIPDYGSTEDSATLEVISGESESTKPLSGSKAEGSLLSGDENSQISGELLGNTGNSETGINIELFSGEATVTETTFASGFNSGEQVIESGFTNESVGNLDGSTENTDNRLTVLYIPNQQTLSNTNNAIIPVNTNTGERDGGSNGDGGRTEEGNITILISDISYSGSIMGGFNGRCFGLKYCLIVEDNNGLLGWYINIDQTPMLSSSNELDDTDLFINTTNSALVTISGGSMDARVIPTNGNVNFENDAGHTILSKQRIDGVIGTYALDPSFSILTQHASPGDYNGESIITLYYY